MLRQGKSEGPLCFCRRAVFLASLNSVLLSWGEIAVPMEKELTSSPCGAVPWGKPGLTPSARLPP